MKVAEKFVSINGEGRRAGELAFKGAICPARIATRHGLMKRRVRMKICLLPSCGIMPSVKV